MSETDAERSRAYLEFIRPSHLAKPFERSELVFTVASFAKLIFAQRRS
jgi:hypothetical protein